MTNVLDKKNGKGKEGKNVFFKKGNMHVLALMAKHFHLFLNSVFRFSELQL